MARIEGLIPHILRWENGIVLKPGESAQDGFLRARRKGVTVVKGDRGGPTLCGVTLRTFGDYRQKRGIAWVTESDLARMEYHEWLAILKSLFWDPCRADGIRNQAVANMLVDWRWVNGSQAVRDAQTVLGLAADAVVGPKTLEALNGPASSVFARLKAARARSYNKIVERRPTQLKFLGGWLNRTNSINFE